MKKIMLILAVCVALTACKKEELTKGISFKEGQTVTLTVGSGDDSNTKIYSEDGVNLKWKAGDQIKVTVNGKSSTFTLKTGAGTGTATFEGTMPASGTSFDIQYPVENPDLSQQDGNLNKIDNGLIKFTATNCTSTSCNLVMQSAIVKIPIQGGFSDDSACDLVLTLNIGSQTYDAEFTYDNFSDTYYFVVEPFTDKTMTFLLENPDENIEGSCANQSCIAGKMLTMSPIEGPFSE